MKIALLGYMGYWGQKLYRMFDQLSQTIFPIDPSSGVHDFEQHKKMRIKDCDAVVIVTPPETHYALVKEALEAGKHVLVEKPFVKTYDQALELVDLAAASGLTLMVDHTYVYSPAVRKIKEVLESGELGDIIYVEGVRINLGIFQEVNVFYDLLPHDFGIFHYLFGSEGVQSVFGKAYSAVSNIDTVHAFLDFEGMTYAHFHVGWFSPIKVRRMLIAGAEKMLVYDDLQEDFKVQVCDKGVAQFGDVIKHRSGDVSIPKLESGEPLMTMAKHFLDCCEGKQECMTDGRSAAEGIKMIQALIVSSTEGREIWI